MTIASYNAYEGSHTFPRRGGLDLRVRVFFVSGETTRAYNKARGVAPGMPAYRKFGWYWLDMALPITNVLDAAQGAFGSSRLAYRDAERVARRRAAA